MQAFILASCLSLQALALAQPPRGQDHPGQDHPSHRYLPPPVGAGTLGEQINSLERLNNFAHAQGDQAAPLELSPAQLKQLDSILESFRGEDGQLDIPSPDSIPKQWIDSLLPDPKQRQQAKEMLEQYSRTRNLPLNSSNDPGGLPPIDNNSSESNRPSSATSTPQSQPRKQSPNDGLRDVDRSSSNGFQSPDTPPRTSSGVAKDPFERERQSKPTDDATGRGNAPSSERTVRDASSGSDQPGSFELPKDTPPALRDLYETLKKFQQQNSQEQRETTSSRLSRKAAEARERAANAPVRSDPRSSRPSTPNNPTQSSGASKSGNASRPTPPHPGNAATPTQPGRSRPQPQLTDDDALNGIGTGGTSRSGGTNGSPSSSDSRTNPSPGDSSLRNSNGSASGNNRPEATDPRPRNINPFEEGFDFSSLPQVPANPFSQSEDPTANPTGGDPAKRFTPPAGSGEPFNVKRMAQQPSPQTAQSRPGPGQPPLGSDGKGAQPSGPTDWKKSVNDLGLGPALKRIYEKTLKEQGYDPKNPAGSGQTGSGQTGSAQTASSGPTASATPPNLPINMPSPQTFEQLKKWGNSVAANPNNSGGSTTNNSTSNANSGWGRWATDTWKSMAESSARSQSSSRRSSSSSSSSSSWSSGSSSAASSGLPEFRWTSSMTLAVLFVAGLILLVVWFSRQRVAELSDSSAAQAEWVRSVVAQGLKTRADVIRAFHQLVKQSRSVSDWWTHRSIVKHFSTHTPQLAPAISELAVVYEQARYYPEDVELSPQQLAQVRTLLESVKIPTSNRV